MVLVAAGLVLASGCKSEPKETTTIVKVGEMGNAPEIVGNDEARTVRATERNVKQWVELNQQGRTTQALAIRVTISRAVDDDFETFAKVSTDASLLLARNMAVKCIGFARENRAEALALLTELCRDKSPTIQANAVLGLGILADKETDLSEPVRLLEGGDIEVRTNAAWALKDLFIVIPTPRELTAQYFTAIERLANLLNDPGSVRARRAAVWALAKLHHPESIDLLIGALEDDDREVQIGALHGLEVLKDQRALEPILEYLDDGPTEGAASWAQKALTSIVLAMGLAYTPSELEYLEANPKLWRKWIRSARLD
jgi:HEAT repeat protein